MTDRELLELAAKAADYSVVGPAPKYIAYGCNEWALLIRNKDGGDSVFDPISDDGDALRLEVDANLTERHRFFDILYEENGKCEGDYRKARRRAIVRAAAEIGKAMP